MADAQLLHVDGGVTGAGAQQRVEACVDIEIAIGSIGRRRLDPADTPAVPGPDAGEVEHQPPGEAGRQRGEDRVARRGHLGQQRDGMLAVPLHQIGERAFIDHADIG